jgi:WD40 repeat protein
MKRAAGFPALIFLLVLIISLLPNYQASIAQESNAWNRIIPKASFGYGGLLSVYWSPLNGQLVAVSEAGFQFYNQNIQLEGERRFSEPANHLSLFSPNMELVAVQEADGLIVRETDTWQPVLALAQHASPSWSPDSRYLAVWVGDMLRVWDVRQAEITLEVDELVSEGGAVQWSPDSQVVAVPGPGAIVMVQAATGSIVRIHPFHVVRDFDWSMDGRWFLVIGLKDPPPLDRDPDIPLVYDLMRMDAISGDIVDYYDLSSGGVPGSLYGADNFVAISPNGRYVAATLNRWEPEYPGQTHTVEVRQPAAVSMPELETVDAEFSFYLAELFMMAIEDGETEYASLIAESVLASAVEDEAFAAQIPDTLRLAEVVSQALESNDTDSAFRAAENLYRRYALPDTSQPAAPPDAIPGDERRAGWYHMGMGLWDLESGEPVHDFSNESRPLANVSYVSWSPDGAYFATSHQQTLVVYEAQTGNIVNSLQAYISSTGRTEFSGNGTRLVAAGGLWDLTEDLPTYLGNAPPQRYQRRIDLSFLEPNPYIFDYNRPPYRWEVLQVYPDRGLVITWEQDIEYPGTPEYEDEEPPEERYIIWDIPSQERFEERVNLGEQTAWIYDLENAHERENGNTVFNVLRTTRFVAIGDDEIIDLRTGEITMLEVNRWEWREVWFSPEGERIYAYDTDSRFKAFDPVTGELLYETVPAPRDAFRYSPDETRFTLVDNTNTVYVYDSVTGELLLEAFTGNVNLSMLWSEDMRRLAIGGDNNAIIIYDIPTQTRLTVLRGHESPITSMGWNPACDYEDIESCEYMFVSSDYDGRVILWAVAEGPTAVVQMPEHPAPPSLELPVAEIDYGALEPLWTYVAEGDQYGREAASSVLWASNGIRVNNNWYYDTTLTLYEEYPGGNDWHKAAAETNDIKIQQDLSVIKADGYVGHVGRDAVFDVAMSPDGQRIFTAERIGSGNTLTGWLREWQIFDRTDRPGQYVDMVEYWGGGSPGYNQVAVSPDGRWIATATLDFYGSGGRGQIWNANNYQRISSLIGHVGSITELMWHPQSGYVLTSGRDGTVRLWDINGTELRRWRYDRSTPVVQMTWGSSPAQVVLSVGDDLVILDSYTLEEIRRLPGVGGQQFDWSPDMAHIVAIGSDSIVRVIDFTNGEMLAEQRNHMPVIQHMDWHPSGKALAVARRDGSVILLDSESGNLDAVLRPYGPALRSMVWDEVGERLLLDVEDGPIEIIDGASGELVTRIENQWRRKGVWWNPDGTKIAFGTFPDPNMGVYTATSLVWVHDVETGEPLYQLSLDWDDYIWYWNVKPFALSWSPDSQHLAAFFGGRLRVWDLNAPGGEIVGTHYDIGHEVGLALWQNDYLNFWMTDGHGQYQISTDELAYIARDGLPAGTLLRPDGRVLLAREAILDFTTFYPLQVIQRGYSDAIWHPTCWSSECPAIIAVAYGTNITMFGYPAEEVANEN